MPSRMVLLFLPLLAGSILAGGASAQRFVSLNGGPPPALTAHPAPPTATAPPCFAFPVCPLAPLPPFPPGVVPPGLGGEAIDQATGITYTTDGLAVMLASAYPGCVVAVP